MHAFDRQTDGRTDGQTEFLSLYRDCIACSAVKTAETSCMHQYCYLQLVLVTYVVDEHLAFLALTTWWYEQLNFKLGTFLAAVSNIWISLPDDAVVTVIIPSATQNFSISAIIS